MRLGIEHEFTITNPTGCCDARELLDTLPLGGRRLDPGDRHAVRCRWGGVVTADGKEGEIATPPLELSPGAVDAVVDVARAGRSALERALPPDHSCVGYSTHLNFETRDRDVVAVARLVTWRFAPAIMLLLDRSDSPGLLVRPRHGRLELGGEYADGDRLRVAVAFGAGIALVAQRARQDRRYARRLPGPLDMSVVRSPQRFGWYVDRRASGDDLYSAGRQTALRLRDGGCLSAGDLLARSWELARAELEHRIDAQVLTHVDATVSSERKLPVDPSPSDRRAAPAAEPAPWPTHLVDDWSVGDIGVTAVAATWHRVVFRARRGDEQRWLTVPGSMVDEFVRRLAAHDLDEWLRRQFSSRRLLPSLRRDDVVELGAGVGLVDRRGLPDTPMGRRLRRRRGRSSPPPNNVDSQGARVPERGPR